LEGLCGGFQIQIMRSTSVEVMVGADNIDYVSSILEWLRKRVLATGLDEGRGDFALGIHC